MSSFHNDAWQNLRRLSFRLFRPKKFFGLQQTRIPLDEHRCIFVHIPKCAGNAVWNSLFGNKYTGGHHNLRRYQIMFGPREFKNYFKFTVVRNPYDRLVSAFFFLKNGGLTETDREWAEENLSPYDTFDAFVRKWVTRKNVQSALHFHPQLDFICLDHKQPGVDFICFYENLKADFSWICRKLRVNSTLREENRNASRAKDYQSYYTAETRKIVADVYADDLQVLGYSFDNSSLQNQLAMRGAGGRSDP